jgi:hypothetical protein
MTQQSKWWRADKRGNRRALFIYLPYEEKGDEERRHGGHQSKNQVLQLREPLHMEQESKKALVFYDPLTLTHSTSEIQEIRSRS